MIVTDPGDTVEFSARYPVGIASTIQLGQCGIDLTYGDVQLFLDVGSRPLGVSDLVLVGSLYAAGCAAR